MGIGKITDYESKLIQVAVKELKANIEKGVKFVHEQYKKQIQSSEYATANFKEKTVFFLRFEMLIFIFLSSIRPTNQPEFFFAVSSSPTFFVSTEYSHYTRTATFDLV